MEMNSTKVTFTTPPVVKELTNEGSLKSFPYQDHLKIVT